MHGCGTSWDSKAEVIQSCLRIWTVTRTRQYATLYVYCLSSCPFEGCNMASIIEEPTAVERTALLSPSKWRRSPL